MYDSGVSVPDIFIRGKSDQDMLGKKIVRIVTFIIFISLALAFFILYPKVSSLKLYSRHISLAKGVSSQLKYDSRFRVQWSSDDDKVVSVNKTGSVKAHKTGKARITARCLWYSKSCVVDVTEPTLSATEISIVLGSQKQLSVLGTRSEPHWDNSNPDVVLFEDGILTPVSPGEATITATVDSAALTAKVVVPEPSVAPVSVDKGSRGHLSLENYIGDNIRWSVSPQDIISISAEGPEAEVTGLNVGKADIVVSYGEREAVSSVCVNGDQGLEILANDAEVGERQELKIKNLIGCYKVTWEDLKPDKKGRVYFEQSKQGEYVVKATVDTGNGQVQLEKRIKISKKEASVSKWEGEVGESFEFSLSDADNAEYVFDKTYLVRNGNTFKAIKEGTTRILIKDGDDEFVCEVYINASSDDDNDKVTEENEDTEETEEDEENDSSDEYSQNMKDPQAGDMAASLYSGNGNDVIEYASRFLGNPYRYGGSSLTEGTDCSGFVMKVYEYFGYSLPHSSSGQRDYGISIPSLSDAVAGDILCYDGHVALYMGNGRIIHASNQRTGICISDYPEYRKIVSIRRLIF